MESAIDSLRFLGDVGDTDLHVLEHILPHCTVDQLMHIENSSKGRDLTPVTDNLWKNFYEKKFGKNDFDSVIERMQRKKEAFKWKELYEAKIEELEKKAQKIEAGYIQRCQELNAKKQSRQIKFVETTEFGCTVTDSNLLKNPNREAQMCPVSYVNNNKKNKRQRLGVTTKHVHKQSKIWKKAKKEALECLETQNAIAYRRNAIMYK